MPAHAGEGRIDVCYLAVMNLGLALLVVAGCGSMVSMYTVAVGSSGTLAGRPTGCRLASADASTRVRLDGTTYTALAPGKARITCAEHEAYELDIRAPARIELVAQSRDVAGYVQLTVVAFDDRGTEIRLGDATHIDWDIPTTLETRPGCVGDIVPRCDPPYVIGVRPKPGPAGGRRVRAQLGPRQATIDVAPRFATQ